MVKHRLPLACTACIVASCIAAGCGGAGDAAPLSGAARPCGDGVCVTTVAGSGEFGTADGPAMAAQFFMPHAVAVDAMSQVHVADFGSGELTRLVSRGNVFTLADDPIEFPFPGDVAIDAAGNRYVAEGYGNRIVRVLPDGGTVVVAGTGESGAQDGDGATATFSAPSGLAFDASGALYVADMGNRRIRKITFGAGA
jgi:hypothetical protein